MECWHSVEYFRVKQSMWLLVDLGSRIQLLKPSARKPMYRHKLNMENEKLRKCVNVKHKKKNIENYHEFRHDEVKRAKANLRVQPFSIDLQLDPNLCLHLISIVYHILKVKSK